MQCKLHNYLCTLIVSIISYKEPIKINNLSIFYSMEHFYSARPNVKNNYVTSDGLILGFNIF